MSLSSKYTIEGEGPLAGRRFDLRFFVLVARGRVYLHSNGWAKWTTGGPRYDPRNTDLERQVPNVAAYAGGDTARLVFHHDFVGGWRGDSDGSGSEEGGGRRTLDPHGWRDAVADALGEAREAVFAPLLNLTAADPATYVLLGADFLIREDRTAVVVEFNHWADLMSKYTRLQDCLARRGCRRLVVPLSGRDGGAAAAAEDAAAACEGATAIPDNYYVTGTTTVTDILSVEAITAVLQDTAALVMGLRQPEEIPLFREIRSRTPSSLKGTKEGH